jgi:hypothetical protein
MRIITAAAAKVARLYHYQRHKPERLKQVLAGTIYMSPPHDFNDPWDCRPCFNDDVTNPDIRRRQVEFLYGAARKVTPYIPEAEHRRRADELSRDPAALRASIEQVSSGIADGIAKRYRVYCLTSKSDDTLMWSHYAENHRGVCLEFGIDNDAFCGALEVEYCETYPALDLADEDDDTLLLPLLTKAACWSYEDEYRLIAQEKAAAGNFESLITEKNLLPLPANALKAVIIGCLTPPAQREEIQKIVEASGRDIALKQAVRAPNRYELTIAPFA